MAQMPEPHIALPFCPFCPFCPSEHAEVWGPSRLMKHPVLSNALSLSSAFRYLLLLGAHVNVENQDGDKPADLIDPDCKELAELFGVGGDWAPTETWSSTASARSYSSLPWWRNAICKFCGSVFFRHKRRSSGTPIVGCCWGGGRELMGGLL